MLHVPVDGMVPQREDQNEPQERDRQERYRRLGEADDEPRPLGVGDLLHGGERHTAAREAGEVEPVDVEELPGALRVFAAERADEEDQPEDGESAADAEKQVVLARQCPLDEARVHGARIHRGRPPVEPVADGPGAIGAAAPAGSCGAGACACSLRT